MQNIPLPPGPPPLLTPKRTTKRRSIVMDADGYPMIKHQKKGEKQYWRCLYYDSGCKARAIGDFGQKNFTRTESVHSCNGNDEVVLEVC